MPRALIRRPWRSEDDAKLSVLVERGQSNAMIAAKLRRSVLAVAARKIALGLTNHPNASRPRRIERGHQAESISE
jgi:hypothetical protein